MSASNTLERVLAEAQEHTNLAPSGRPALLAALDARLASADMLRVALPRLKAMPSLKRSYEEASDAVGLRSRHQA